MTISDFLSKLQRVKKQTGDAGHLASCPAHGGSDGDRNPSLSVKEADGKILLKCFAGCSADAVLSAMGLEPADLFAKEERQKRTIVHEYNYRDEAGVLLFQAIRYWPKGFSQRRPDGSNGWIYNLTDVRRVVYRLPELKGQKAIVFGEGEKDADRAWTIGIPATCNPMGAGKWDDAYADQLKAQGVIRVAVIPDNDEPGAAHATRVTAGLQKAGIEVRLVPLPGVPDKGDLSDYLEKHTREDLLALIKAAPIADTIAVVPKATEPDRQFAHLEDGRYRFLVRSKGITLEIGHLYRHKDGNFNGELVAKVNGHFPDAKTHGDGVLSLGDFNLASVQARSTRAKLLADRAGDKEFDWFGLLEEFVISVVTHQGQGDPPIVLADDLDFEDVKSTETWDIDGLPVLVDDPMILFGDSGGGKSYLALWVAGTLAERGIKVLYVDWEFSKKEHKKRLGRLFQPPSKNLHYVRCDAPLIKEAPRLARLIAEYKYEYLICDSIGFAVDGPAETHESARGYFGALRTLNIGTLSLAHIAKKQDDGREATIFGSAFYRAGARSAWFVEPAKENPKGELNIGLHHRKSNSSELRKPLAYKLLFRGDRVIVEKVDMAIVESLSEQLPLLDRLRRHMTDGELYNYKDLGEDLGVAADTIRKATARSKFFSRIGKKVRLRAQEPPPPDEETGAPSKVIRHEF